MDDYYYEKIGSMHDWGNQLVVTPRSNDEESHIRVFNQTSTHYDSVNLLLT